MNNDKVKVTVGCWTIDMLNDDDGHLTMGINNLDGSRVVVVEEDVTANSTEWAERFTTEEIEDDYQNEQEQNEIPRMGICPACGKEGVEEKGCRTCPGFWFTLQPYIPQDDPDCCAHGLPHYCSICDCKSETPNKI